MRKTTKKPIRALRGTKATPRPRATASTATGAAPQREYVIADLVNIASQLGCRVRFELIPLELLNRPVTTK